MKTSFDIAISTAPRTPAFIHKTMAGLIRSDKTLADLLPVYLFADATDSSFLQQYDSIACRIGLSKAELQIRQNWTDARLATLYNYWRCLHHFRESEKNLLVCEDDISFAPDWIQTLLPIIEHIYTEIGDTFLLTLYSPYDWPNIAGPKHTLPYILMRKIGFYGTQAVLFSPKARILVQNYLWNEGIQKLHVPTDLRVRDCCLENGIPIITLLRSLVQHEGFVSTGNTGELSKRGLVHQSPTFIGNIASDTQAT